MSQITRYKEQDAPNLLTSDDLRKNALQRFGSDLLNRSQATTQSSPEKNLNSLFDLNGN